LQISYMSFGRSVMLKAEVELGESVIENESFPS